MTQNGTGGLSSVSQTFGETANVTQSSTAVNATSTILQGGVGSAWTFHNNSATVLQTGTDVTSTINQTGLNGTASVTQGGVDNTSLVNQGGNGNSATVTQN